VQGTFSGLATCNEYPLDDVQKLKIIMTLDVDNSVASFDDTQFKKGDPLYPVQLEQISSSHFVDLETHEYYVQKRFDNSSSFY